MTVRTLLWATLVAFCACGGGGPGSAPKETVFRVTQVTPFEDTEDVPLTAEVNVIFSKEVDPASLDSESLCIIAESGDRIPGQRLVAPLNRAVVRFLPLLRYYPFAVHTIRVTQGVRDINGNPLDQEYAFHFQTEAETSVLPKATQLENPGDLLRVGRWFHRMTLLPNNRFLVAGGYTQAGATTATAENLIAPLRESFLLAGSMQTARAAHVQLSLADGRVLIAGGEVSDEPFVPLAECEMFDPATFTFGPAASMHFARSFAHATRLADGRVLVTGGQGHGPTGDFVFREDAEIYDPATDSWTLVANAMEQGRSGHYSGLLSGGDVVVVGGTPGEASAARWVRNTERFATGFAPPSFDHFFGAGTILPDGRPLVASGFNATGVTIYDPGFGFIGATNRLIDERTFATATAFEDGRVLIVGGTDYQVSPALLHNTIDLFFPIGQTGKVLRVTDIRLPRPTSHHAAARGPEGAVWISGGLPTDASLPGLRQVVLIHPEEP